MRSPRLCPMRIRITRGRVAGDATCGTEPKTRIEQVSAAFQEGRPVAQALCVMKGVLELLGFGQGHMLPLLRPWSAGDLEVPRERLREVGLES